jgi:hypothetical protein
LQVKKLGPISRRRHDRHHYLLRHCYHRYHRHHRRHDHGIQVSLNPNLYENPGDFIIDALDLSGVQDEFEDFEEKKVRKPILGPINQR